MATPDYLKMALTQQEKAIEELKKRNQLYAEQDLKKAEALKDDASRAAKTDYTAYINPYGVQAEAYARRGLKSSGLSQTNMARAYSDYQNRLGLASSAYAQSMADIDAQLKAANLQSDSDLYNLRADYYINMYNALNKASSGGSGRRSSGGSSKKTSGTGSSGENIELIGNANDAYARYKNAKTQQEKDYYYRLYINMLQAKAEERKTTLR